MPSDQESRRRVRHILEQDVSQVALQALFQSAQCLYEKMEWSGSASLTNGSGAGRPKSMRIPVPVPSLKLFANFDHFVGEECVHTAGEVSALPLYKRPGLASGLSPNSPGRVVSAEWPWYYDKIWRRKKLYNPVILVSWCLLNYKQPGHWISRIYSLITLITIRIIFTTNGLKTNVSENCRVFVSFTVSVNLNQGLKNYGNVKVLLAFRIKCVRYHI